MPSHDKSHIKSLQLHSQCINFQDWISLYTLCLAPLLAHIASGAPSPSCLAHVKIRPSWLDYLCLYNPTSILWRYAAIADRRIRAIYWSLDDFAASNAVFWTNNGWDGAENMVIVAAPHCLQYPRSTHAQLFSTSTLKTIITTLQGVAIVYALISLELENTLGSLDGWGLDVIFYPLSLLGLLRLCAAFWLTDDFVYAPQLGLSYQDRRGSPTHATEPFELQGLDYNAMLDPFLVAPAHGGQRFRGTKSSLPSWAFRGGYLLALFSIWLYALTGLPSGPSLFRASKERYVSLTTALSIIFYFSLSTISIILCAYYFSRGQTTSTLIPCMGSMFYKMYSLAVVAFMLALVVVASIETSKQPYGRYSTYNWPGQLSCSDQQLWWWIVDPSWFLGLVSKGRLNETDYLRDIISLQVASVSANNLTGETNYWLYNFTGYCVGRLEDSW